MLILLDLDVFKRINDQPGHEPGDAVLVEFAQGLRDITRSSDDCFRLRGDEFLNLKIDMDIDYLIRWFDNLKAVVATIWTKLIQSKSPGLELGISGGCVNITYEDDHMKSVVQRADLALYRASGAGTGRLETDISETADPQDAPPRSTTNSATRR